MNSCILENLVAFFIILLSIPIMINSLCEERYPCGERPFFSSRRGQRIYHGHPANKGLLPWQANLQDKVKPYRMHCGAVIIHRFWVLIAANCVGVANKRAIYYRYGEGMVIVAGQTNDYDKSSRQIRDISHVMDFNHPQNPEKDDIALLKLSSPFKFNSFVQPICIAQNGESFVNQTCIFSGWGPAQFSLPTRPKYHHYQPKRIHRLPYLFGAYGRVMSWRECAIYIYRKYPSWINEMTKYKSPGWNIICTIGFPKEESSTCNEDSGGPLTCQRPDGSFVLAGVIKPRPEHLCGIGLTLYAKVSYYHDWIRQTIGVNV